MARMWLDSRSNINYLYFMFKPLSNLNAIAQFKAETFASSSVSFRLPVILLRKSNHILTPESALG